MSVTSSQAHHVIVDRPQKLQGQHLTILPCSPAGDVQCPDPGLVHTGVLDIPPCPFCSGDHVSRRAAP